MTAVIKQSNFKSYSEEANDTTVKVITREMKCSLQR